MREDLLGYLLGALEPHEMRRVERWLRDDQTVREELAKIQRSLEPLAENAGPVEPPPPDLVARTLAGLPPLHSPSDEPHGDSETHGGPRRRTSPARPAEYGPMHDAPQRLAPMQSGVETSKDSAFTWIDWASGAVAAVILLGLLLPSLAQGRFEARKIACQNQLRQFGIELTSFVNRNQQSHLPAVAEHGPNAFAGIYAMRLNEAGLLDDPSIRWCPSVDPVDRDSGVPGERNLTVSIDDLAEMPVDQLRRIQRNVGGHYAYTLGVVDQDHFTPPRYEARSSFAVMSDAPMVTMVDGKVPSESIGHGGHGINVLYEDGRVQFLSLSAIESMPDHPLLNHRRRAEAGVNIDDASLAPSWRPPFANVPQR